MSRSDRTTSGDDGTVTGALRIEPSVRTLLRRLRPGDVAVIDILDLDQQSAEALAARRPAAVVDVQSAISGRYPTGGPRVLLEADIPLIDEVGGGILGMKDGAQAAISGSQVLVGGEVIAEGRRVTLDVLTEAMVGATEGLRVQLATFTANAMDHVEREADTILDGAGLPEVGLDLDGRHVVIIAPGLRHREQLTAIRRYVRDHRPILIAVGEAADATLALASAPHLIIGDVDGVGDDALRSADRVLLHEPRGGASGQARVDALGLAHSVSDSALSSVALAILMAHSGGASVIVTVGVESSLQDYLDTSQADASGTFLARLQAGTSIVDAPAVAQVYRHRYSAWTLALLVLSGLLALAVAIASTPAGRAWVADLWTAATSWIGGT
ncbi:putative cytokinetic ring protein SteA [Demequina aestuarii]|uniref:putative cytokinetic ring protein SteA n=1 Tax=Demequina aestuarii TaxID=327095 RepID=UPI000781EE4B|nr:putative cytokinetic ring protein SteA [Demequina aestuarii]